MVKSRRNASSSGVPNVLSWRISRSAGRSSTSSPQAAFGRRRLVLRAGQDVAAERRHLDRLGAEAHVRQAKPAADDPAVPEQLLDLIRVRVGADVEVLRPPLQQQVADAAADEVGGVVELLQPVENFERIRVDVPARNRVFRTRDDHRLRHPSLQLYRVLRSSRLRHATRAARASCASLTLPGSRAGASTRRSGAGAHRLQPAPVRRGDRGGDRGAPDRRDRRCGRRSCWRARISSAIANAPTRPI